MNMLVARLAEVNLARRLVLKETQDFRSDCSYGAGGAAPSNGSENLMGIPKFDPPKPLSTA